MDTITHGLLGLAIGVIARQVGVHGAGEAGAAAEATRQALFWGSIVAAQAPDLDLITMLRDRLNQMKDHHGLTHSLAGALVLSIAVTAWACWQWTGATFGTVYPWIFIAMLVGHLIPDWLTPFGTRLLLPVRNNFLALDWLAQSEPVMMLVLGMTNAVALLNPVRGHWWAAGGIALAVLFALWRGYCHSRIRQEVQAAYAAAHQVDQVVVHPSPLGLVRYHFAVYTPGLCHLGTAWVGGAVRETSRVPHSQPAPTWDEVAWDRRVEILLRFMRHPVVESKSLPEGGWVFHLTDFRGGCIFHFRIAVNEQMQVVRVRRARLPEPVRAA